jgi:hypothetical protein
MAPQAGHNSVVPHTCGVGVVGHFRNSEELSYWDGAEDLKTLVPTGGCGWVIASFTEKRPEFKEAYEILCKRWKLIYQSPVRVNNRTHRKFFFCIFDSRTPANSRTKP